MCTRKARVEVRRDSFACNVVRQHGVKSTTFNTVDKENSLEKARTSGKFLNPTSELCLNRRRSESRAIAWNLRVDFVRQ